MARRQRRDLSPFESMCHLLTCLPHTAESSRCPSNCWTSSKVAGNTTFSSIWYDPNGNRTRVYRFNSRRSTIRPPIGIYWSGIKTYLACIQNFCDAFKYSLSPFSTSTSSSINVSTSVSILDPDLRIRLFRWFSEKYLRSITKRFELRINKPII